MARRPRFHWIGILALCACAAPPMGAPDGWAHLELRNPEAALRAFDASLAASTTAEALAGRARALFLLGRLEDAEKAYTRALAMDFSEPQWHIGLGLVHLAANAPERAIAACDAALTVAPGSSKAHYNRGYAHHSAGRLVEAGRDYSRALELDPLLAEAFNSRGVIHASAGRHAQALTDFSAALRLTPLPGAHANRAASYYALGDAQRALAELNTAIKLERTRPHHLVQRGRIYLDLNEPALAAADFQAALGLAPTSARCRELLERAHALGALED